MKRAKTAPQGLVGDVRIQEFLDMIAPSIVKFNTTIYELGLIELVKADLEKHAGRVQCDEQQVRAELQKRVSTDLPDVRFVEQEVMWLKKRLTELNGKFATLYEDKVLRKISEDADTGERVQELRKNKRRPTRTGKTNLFSGIVRCADCGEKLYYCTSKNFEARQDHFVCSTSRLKGKEICQTHFIRAVVLDQGVLAHMRLVIACVSTHEERFRKTMGAKQKAEAKKELAAKRRQLMQAERRIEELDRLFKCIYEDNANGKLSDSRFQMLSDDYEQEQEEQAENIDRFITNVQKYLDLDELTPAILNDMVKQYMFTRPTSQAVKGFGRLIYPMTKWGYSPRPCSMTYQTEKRHSRSYAISR